MTNEEFDKRVVVNKTRVKVIRNTCCHSYVIGQTYYVVLVNKRISLNPDTYLLYLMGAPHSEGALVPSMMTYIHLNDVTIVSVSRNEQMQELQKQIKNKEEEIMKDKERLIWLSSYKDELDELVCNLIRLADLPENKRGIVYDVLLSFGFPTDIDLVGNKPKACPTAAPVNTITPTLYNS